MLEIREMTKEDQHLFASIESSLETDEVLDIVFDKHGFKYNFLPCKKIKKLYKPCELPVSNYFENDKHHILFAYLDEILVGQIMIEQYWNNTCYIDDIRVSPKHKGKGVGQALLEVSMDWAMDMGLKGMMLETQHVNTPACKFYFKNGFEIGGIDRYMYKYLGGPEKDEMAIMFYKTLEDE